MEQYIKTLLAGIRQWVNGKIENISFVIASHIVELSERTSAVEQAIEEGAPHVIEEVVGNDVLEQTLDPNKLYVFESRTNNLVLTLGPEISGIANEYHLFIYTGNTAPTITWPSGITWNSGNTPTITADKTYEISILNNIAAFFEV